MSAERFVAEVDALLALLDLRLGQLDRAHARSTIVRRRRRTSHVDGASGLFGAHRFDPGDQ